MLYTLNSHSCLSMTSQSDWRQIIVKNKTSTACWCVMLEIMILFITDKITSGAVARLIQNETCRCSHGLLLPLLPFYTLPPLLANRWLALCATLPTPPSPCLSLQLGTPGLSPARGYIVLKTGLSAGWKCGSQIALKQT